jgi:hypothetical protein
MFKPDINTVRTQHNHMMGESINKLGINPDDRREC